MTHERTDATNVKITSEKNELIKVIIEVIGRDKIVEAIKNIIQREMEIKIIKKLIKTIGIEKILAGLQALQEDGEL